jgi:hypothetical protein
MFSIGLEGLFTHGRICTFRNSGMCGLNIQRKGMQFVFSREAIHPLSCEVMRYFFFPPVPRSSSHILSCFILPYFLKVIQPSSCFLSLLFFRLVYIYIYISFQRMKGREKKDEWTSSKQFLLVEAILLFDLFFISSFC